MVMTHIRTTKRKSKVASRMKKRLTGDIQPPRFVPETMSSLTMMGMEGAEAEFCSSAGGANCTRCWGGGGGGNGICPIVLKPGSGGGGGGIADDDAGWWNMLYSWL